MRSFFFFESFRAQKIFLYIHIYTRNKKKKKKIIFSVSAPRRIFSRSLGRAYTLTPPRRGRALTPKRGSYPRDTCVYAHDTSRSPFRAFWRVLFFVLINYTSVRIKRRRREIARKIWRFGKKVVSLPKISELWRKSNSTNETTASTETRTSG